MSHQRFPRSMREAFPSERYAAIEVHRAFDPERHIVLPAIVLVAVALVVLFSIGVL